MPANLEMFIWLNFSWIKNIHELYFYENEKYEKKNEKDAKETDKISKENIKKTMGKKQKKNCNGSDAAGVCDCLPKKKEPGPFSEWKN